MIMWAPSHWWTSTNHTWNGPPLTSYGHTNQGNRAVERHAKVFFKISQKKSVLDSQHQHTCFLLQHLYKSPFGLIYTVFHPARRTGMQRKRGGAFFSNVGQRRSDLYLSNNARSYWDELACSGMMAAGLNVWEAYCSEENACIGVLSCSVFMG